MRSRQVHRGLRNTRVQDGWSEAQPIKTTARLQFGEVWE
ncbi:hypothetical protein SAMN05216420_11538 [Nitrosospira sp. Nl5]|nr:hypothetical protein SAMN05216420_11538 [Nitrosospira sp. Nl5]